MLSTAPKIITSIIRSLLPNVVFLFSLPTLSKWEAEWARPNISQFKSLEIRRSTFCATDKLLIVVFWGSKKRKCSVRRWGRGRRKRKIDGKKKGERKIWSKQDYVRTRKKNPRGNYRTIVAIQKREILEDNIRWLELHIMVWNKCNKQFLHSAFLRTFCPNIYKRVWFSNF